MIQQDMVKYRKISGFLGNICKEYDTHVESPNLDEFGLDITDYLVKHDLNSEMGKKFVCQRIRKSVKKKLGFELKVGIGPNSLIARVIFYFYDIDFMISWQRRCQHT